MHVEVPLSGGFWRRAVGFLRRPQRPAARVWLAYATLTATADDDGTVIAELVIANVGSRPLVVERFKHFSLMAGGYDFGVSAPTYDPPTAPIPPGDVAVIRPFYRFGAPGVRQLVRSTQPAGNLRSSPILEVALRGSLEVRSGKHTERVDVNLRTVMPRLNLTCPAARDAR